ncbi:cupin domain-containing protein [Pseudomonas sp. Q1-7]|uniref:cupin domain-containing protein n=1 Tax=Pseudomonas sp. Q1-7 TaxID=3020843 RepID=UPI002301861E|nr:cupin domain-containing protein [Pseudomonas sp. Q1-7]
MTPLRIRLDDATPFTPASPVGAPVGEPLVLTRTALHQELPGQRAVTGFWECSPGRFRRQVVEAEYSYIVSGEGSFTPDGGEPIDFREGDALYFAANTQGTWEVRSPVRKTYLILG